MGRLIQIQFGEALLVLTRDEFRRALRRGLSVKKNRRLAEKRREHTQTDSITAAFDQRKAINR